MHEGTAYIHYITIPPQPPPCSSVLLYPLEEIFWRMVLRYYPGAICFSPLSIPSMYHLSFMCTRYMERYLPECDLTSVAHVRDCSLASSARNARPIRVTARYIRAVCAIGESTYAPLQPQSNARESVEMHQSLPLPSLSPPSPCRLCQAKASYPTTPTYLHPCPCIHTDTVQSRA